MLPSTSAIPPVRTAHAHIALAVRHGNDPSPHRREFTAAKLRRAIDDALADPFAPSPEHLAELADLLSGGVR